MPYKLVDSFSSFKFEIIKSHISILIFTLLSRSDVSLVGLIASVIPPAVSSYSYGLSTHPPAWSLLAVRKVTQVFCLNHMILIDSSSHTEKHRLFQILHNILSEYL